MQARCSACCVHELQHQHDAIASEWPSRLRLTWQANNGIAQRPELDHIHDLLHEVCLNLAADSLGQPQEGAVGQRLVHRGLRIARIRVKQSWVSCCVFIVRITTLTRCFR